MPVCSDSDHDPSHRNVRTLEVGLGVDGLLRTIAKMTPPDERMGASSPLGLWIRAGAPRQVPGQVARMARIGAAIVASKTRLKVHGL